MWAGWSSPWGVEPVTCMRGFSQQGFESLVYRFWGFLRFDLASLDTSLLLHFLVCSASHVLWEGLHRAPGTRGWFIGCLRPALQACPESSEELACCPVAFCVLWHFFLKMLEKWEGKSQRVTESRAQMGCVATRAVSNFCSGSHCYRCDFKVLFQAQSEATYGVGLCFRISKFRFWRSVALWCICWFLIMWWNHNSADFLWISISNVLEW